jgi:hydrogenase maturation protease
MSHDQPVLVLGLGNPVMADDGAGLAAMARLQAGWAWGKGVVFEDGGTWGMRLLPLLQDHDRVLFLDAIDGGRAPGALIRLDGDAIPRGIGLGKVSPHQVDLQDILAAAMLTGRLPREMIALGVQPELVEMRVGLSPAVEAGLDGLVAAAIEALSAWGVSCEPAGATAGA